MKNRYYYLGLSFCTVAFVYCLINYPLYRYFIFSLTGVSTAFLFIRVISLQLNGLTADWGLRTAIKQERANIDLDLMAKSRIIQERSFAIKSIGEGILHTHSPKKSEILALPSGQENTINMPTEILMGNFKLHSTLKQMFVGVNGEGRPTYVDFTNSVHTVIAGATGGGKSNFANVLINQIMVVHEQVELDLIDMGSNTFSDYGIPCATEVREVEGIFRKWLEEFKRRTVLFGETKGPAGLAVKEFKRYNEVSDDPLPYSIMIIEEGADLFSSKFVTEALGQLLRKARKAGLYIILITQAAMAEDLPTKFRGQFLSRIQFHNKEKTLNRMLGDIPEGSLDCKGRAYLDIYEHEVQVVQTPLVEDSDVVRAIKNSTYKGSTPYVIIDEPVKEEWPKIKEGTTKQRMASFAEHMMDLGTDLKEIPPVEVVKHLDLNGNGRDYREWDKTISNLNGKSE